MRRRVHTPDGVPWSVSVGRPRLAGRSGDLRVGEDGGRGGFGPLLTVSASIVLLVLAPVLVQSGRGWWLLAVPVLALLAWLTLGRYPVEIRRAGAREPLHRTLVAGRRQARRIAEELAAEIERTPDEKLIG